MKALAFWSLLSQIAVPWPSLLYRLQDCRRPWQCIGLSLLLLVRRGSDLLPLAGPAMQDYGCQECVLLMGLNLRLWLCSIFCTLSFEWLLLYTLYTALFRMAVVIIR